MSLYRWEHEDPLHPATEGLPNEAIAALDALMDAVVFDPMDYARSPTEPVGKNVRHLALPGGRGQVSILIYEPDLLVLVLSSARDLARLTGVHSHPGRGDRRGAVTSVSAGARRVWRPANRRTGLPYTEFRQGPGGAYMGV